MAEFVAVWTAADLSEGENPPATEPVRVFRVRVEDDEIQVEA
jgi:hypothetical protein